MLELIKLLLGLSPDKFRDVLPILRAILYSPALTEAVRKTQSPVDDLVLRVLRALIPPE